MESQHLLPDGELADLEAWRQLAAAVLLRAVQDAHNRNGRKATREAELPEGVTLAGDAQRWLRSRDARWLAAMIGLDPDCWEGALARLPDLTWDQLRLPVG